MLSETEQLQTMIGILQTQRNIAYDQVVQLGAQNASLQKELAQLTAELAQITNKKQGK